MVVVVIIAFLQGFGDSYAVCCRYSPYFCRPYPGAWRDMRRRSSQPIDNQPKLLPTTAHKPPVPGILSCGG